MVFLIYFNRHNPFQLFDTALHLYGFGCLIAETFDELFRVLNLLLLVFVGTQLLFTPLLAEYHIFIIRDLVIINTPTGDFNRPVGHIINKGTVVTDQYHCITVIGQKTLKPLNTLYIQVIGGFVKQQDIGTLQQQFGQFDTHTPPATELRSRTFEIVTTESQPDKSPLNLGLIVTASHQQETFVFM